MLNKRLFSVFSAFMITVTFGIAVIQCSNPIETNTESKNGVSEVSNNTNSERKLPQIYAIDNMRNNVLAYDWDFKNRFTHHSSLEDPNMRFYDISASAALFAIVLDNSFGDTRKKVFRRYMGPGFKWERLSGIRGNARSLTTCMASTWVVNNDGEVFYLATNNDGTSEFKRDVGAPQRINRAEICGPTKSANKILILSFKMYTYMGRLGQNEVPESYEFVPFWDLELGRKDFLYQVYEIAGNHIGSQSKNSPCIAYVKKSNGQKSFAYLNAEDEMFYIYNQNHPINSTPVEISKMDLDQHGDLYISGKGGKVFRYIMNLEKWVSIDEIRVSDITTGLNW